MDEDDELLHLPYSTLQEVSSRKRAVTPAEWWHLHVCQSCLLKLAELSQIRMTLEELRKKFIA